MDMIEYAIFSLASQARGIARHVPNDEKTRRFLVEGAAALDRAANQRHGHRIGGDWDDDYEQAQRDQLEKVEREIKIPIHKKPISRR